MGISTRVRKSLWGKSGNRCAFCKIELLSKTDSSEFNIGEECHIISSKKKGPRYKSNIEDYDTYDNLILLCRNHHKQIDTLTECFSEEVLRFMKSEHENWVKDKLSENKTKSSNPKPKFLNRITSGKQLFNIISGSHGYITDYDEIENEEDVQFIASFLQNLTDIGDVSEMIQVAEGVKIAYELRGAINDLEKKGFLLFGETNNKKIKHNNGDVDTWSIATIIVKQKDSSDIIFSNELT